MKNLFRMLHTLFPELILWTCYPAFLSWFAVSAGIWVAFSFETPQFFSFVSYNLFYIGSRVLATITLFCGIFFRKKSVRLISFFLLAITVCTIREQDSLRFANFLTELNEKESHYQITAVCASIPVKKGYYYTFPIKKAVISNDKFSILKSKTILCKSTVTPQPNHILKINGRIQLPRKQVNPYAFNEASYLKANNISAVLYAESILIDKKKNSTLLNISILFRKKVISILNNKFKNPDHKAILSSAFLGEKQYLTPQIKDNFRNSGIYHLLAISGLHAGMLIAAAYAFLSIFPLNKKWKFLFSLLFLWLYLFFIGFIPSLFRATVMTSLIINSFLFQKKNYPVHSLGLAGTIWLLLSPQSLFLPGYQLSFSATFGIITLSPVLNRFNIQVHSPCLNFLITKVLSGFYISVCGFVSTAPVLLYHFGTVSIFGIFANIAAVTAMTACMWSFFTTLILNIVFPFYPVFSFLPEKCCTLALAFIISLTKISSCLKWSELSFSAPFAELIILYTVFTCLLITINKEFFFRFLKWSIPLFFSFCVIILLVKKTDNDVKIVRFYEKDMSLSAICWPHKGIWLTFQGNYKKLNKISNYLLAPWMHHNPGTFVEKIFVIKKYPDLCCLKNPDQECGCQMLTNGTLSYVYKANNSRDNYTIKIISDSAGYNFEIKGQNTWTSFNTADSLISFGKLNNFKTRPVPAQINISTKRVYNKTFK